MWGFASAGTGLLSSEVFAETKITKKVSEKKQTYCSLAEVLDFFVYYVPGRLWKSSGLYAASTSGKYQAWERGSAVQVNLVIYTALRL